MERVGSRFHTEVDDAVARLTELRREIALKHLEFLNRVSGDAFVPLGVRGYQRYRNPVHEYVSPAHLPAVDLEVIGGIASRVVAHVPHKSRNQRDELYWIANRARNLKREIVNQAILHGSAEV